MAKEKPEEPKGQEDKVESSEPTKASKENSLVKIRSKNFVILTEYLKKQGIDPAVFLHSNKATLSRIAEGNKTPISSRCIVSKKPLRRFLTIKSVTAKSRYRKMKIMALSNGPRRSVISTNSLSKKNKD